MKRAVFLLALFFTGFVAIGTSRCFATDYFLHTTTNDLLNNNSPTATTAQFKDSPSLNRTTYQEIGNWSAAPLSTAIELTSLSGFVTWIGLKNSDDQGTYFDLRAELKKNGVTIATGEIKSVQGVTRNAANAKEVTVNFGPVSDTQFNTTDVLSIKILTKVADSGGHKSAVGLRLYYDAISRASRFGATFAPVTPPSLVTIASPGSESVINDHSVLVTGHFDTLLGVEVGINVNGYVALQHGDEFAALIPVDAQTTSLTATVTSTAGTILASQSVPVTVQPPTTESVLFFRPSPAIALVNQPVTFTLTSLNTFSQVQLDGNGDGTIDFTGTTLEGLGVPFAEAGLYFPTVRVTEQGGEIRTATTVVQVFDGTQLDTMLKNKWDAMKNALRQGDINLAVTHIVARRRATYQAMFNALTVPLINIDQVLPSIAPLELRGIEAEYEMTVMEGGFQHSFLVLFAIDEDGVWRIKFF